jgi:hypothetical protein
MAVVWTSATLNGATAHWRSGPSRRRDRRRPDGCSAGSRRRSGAWTDRRGPCPGGESERWSWSAPGPAPRPRRASCRCRFPSCAAPPPDQSAAGRGRSSTSGATRVRLDRVAPRAPGALAGLRPSSHPR